MSKTTRRTIADFKAAHDPDTIVPNKIRTALAEIEKVGPEHFEYEVDFLKLAGISTTQIGQYRDQFADYWLITPGTNGNKSAKRVYFGNTKIVKKLKGT